MEREGYYVELLTSICDYYTDVNRTLFYMKIFTNGCSHTRSTPEAIGDMNLAYPYLLQLNYAAKLDNYSMSGNSNDTIFRTTYEYILSQMNQPDLVVIQWTFHERIELNIGDIENRDFKILNPSSFYDKKKHDSPEVLNFIKLLSDRLYPDGSRMHSPHTRYSDTSISHKVLNYTLALQLLFEEYNIKNYKFIIWSGVDDNYITYKKINKSRCIFSAEHLLSKKYDKHPTDGHYMVEAHEEIADWIINDISSPNLKEYEDNTIYDYTGL
jgi:hypothetical protein